MNPSHYPSLELCKKLTEIGFPDTENQFIGGKDPVFGNTYYYIKPSVMEMLDVMPIDFWANCKHYFLHIHFDMPTVEYTDSDEGNYLEGNNGYTTFCNKSLPNALAEMTLWLHENNYISFNK